MVQVAPSRPPRFIEPMTTLSSRAPRSSSSSTTSGVPSTPSTSGWLSASARRASSERRSAIAIGSPPDASAPRAGWSAATRNRVPRSLRIRPGRRRAAYALAIAPGSPARVASRSRHFSSERVGALMRWLLGGSSGRDHGVELGDGGHGVGAGQARGDQRTGGVGVLRAARRLPAGQQPVHQRAAERVAGAETADDLDRVRGYDGRPVGGGDEHSVAAHLHQRQLDAAREQPLGRLVRVAGADRDLDLGPVADGDGHVVEHRVVLGARLLRRRPEHLAPVEVEDGPAARAGLRTWAPGQHLELGGARGLDAHAGAGHPQDRHVGHHVPRDVLGGDRQVGSDRRPVERERRVLGRVELAEDDWRLQPCGGADVRRVHAEAGQRLADVVAEAVRSHLGEYGRFVAEPGRTDRDVGRGAAEGLRERRDVLQRYAGLLRVEVDTDPADSQELQHRCQLEVGKWRLAPLACDCCGQREVTTLARV